jgi:hypothetical protein
MNQPADLVERALGDAGLLYLDQMLRQGKRLASALRENTPLRQGRAFTMVPPDVTAEQYLKPDVDRFSMCGTVDASVPVIVDYLRNTGTLAIFEEELFRRSDPCMEHDPLPAAYLGDDVYYCISEPDPVLVEQVLLAVDNPWLFVAALTPWAEPLPTLSEQVLVTIASTAEMVIVNAYHGEGFVAWRR